MRTRSMEKLGITTSLLGFGCMRFPMKNGEIDKERTAQMFDYAYEHGINYYDTAYLYHGGKSEGVMGEMLRKYPRNSFYIADKLPVWLMKSEDDLEKIFQTQLDRLGLGTIDFYLIHALNRDRWETAKNFHVLDFLEKKRAEGKIKYIGFSYHDNPEVLKEVINDYDWDFVQIQLNYADWEGINAKSLYQIIEKKGLPCIIMEPVKGGDLAKPPVKITQLFENSGKGWSPAAWALRWVASLPNVNVVLSGMSDLEQIKENMKTFSEFEPMTKEESAVIDEAAAVWAAIPHIGCTGCRYCMPCPSGVAIPDNFSFYGDYQKFQNKATYSIRYHALESANAEKCAECGLCKEKCPQHIDIPGELKKMRQLALSLR